MQNESETIVEENESSENQETDNIPETITTIIIAKVKLLLIIKDENHFL